ncbi:MAG: hypothetical protein ACYC65_01295 [Candidatus Limnocylindrales bacterium]
MRRKLICAGVLGGGTALVFGAAALTSALIRPSRIVPQNQNAVFQRVMPANIAPGPDIAPVPAIRVDDASRADILVELPAPEETR